MRKPGTVILSSLLLFAACTGDSAVAPEATEPVPAFAKAGESGCYTVKGTIFETGLFPNFSGIVSGDLEGTSETTLGFGGINGKVISNPGTRTVEITGGAVPALVGATLEQSFKALSINTGAGPIRINERTTVESGAARGTLTTHGWLNVNTFPLEVDLKYNGVICL